MSYMEELTARRDFVQAQAFLIARRFVYHTKTDPLGLEFSLDLTNKDRGYDLYKDLQRVASEEVLLAKAEEIDARNKGISETYHTKPILMGFTAEDLTVIQYGRMVSRMEVGLNPNQQKRWQALEAELLAGSIIGDFADAKLGHSNYSPDQVVEVAKQLNNPYIDARIDDADFLADFFSMLKPMGEEPDNSRDLRKERSSKNLPSLTSLLYATTQNEDADVPETVQQVDDYIVERMLPLTE